MFHGVRLQDGRREHEIDVLVVWPGRGLAVIEVKGGHITHDGDGWHQSDRTGRRRINPVGQAQSARHALQNLLRANGVRAASARIVHLVAFPFVELPPAWQALELARTMVIDRTDLNAPFGAAGRVERAIEDFGQRSSRLVEQDVPQLEAAIHSQLDESPATGIAEHEAVLEQRTREQRIVLDLLASQVRAQVTGNAGSGKTWMAMEQARRLARDGRRVALVCYSRGLGKSFQREVAQWRPAERPAYVGLFHDIAQQWGGPMPPDDSASAEEQSEYYETGLPIALRQLAERQPASQLFEGIVVDEAQDFGALWWPALEACMRDPATGRLFVFMDADQTLFPRDGRPPIDTPPFALKLNLRSTKQIAQVFGALTDVQIEPRGGDGPPVGIVDVPYADALEAADDVVEGLLDGPWRPGQVALLTTGSRHTEQRNLVEVNGIDAYWDDFFAEQDVFYAHVLNFKGLERSAVVLAVNGFRDRERARSLLYTGMSRARSLLVLVGPRAEIEAIGGHALSSRLQKARPWPFPD